MGEAYTPNAATGRGGRSGSGAGRRSESGLTDEVREADRSRASGPPVPGEYKDVRTARPDGEYHREYIVGVASYPALFRSSYKAIKKKTARAVEGRMASESREMRSGTVEKRLTTVNQGGGMPSSDGRLTGADARVSTAFLTI
jgi:hypothetical protein